MNTYRNISQHTQKVLMWLDIYTGNIRQLNM